jgi:hypothetical protein
MKFLHYSWGLNAEDWLEKEKIGFFSDYKKK